jgi:hypothetical protein
MPKRKCAFTENLKAEYLFINEDQHANHLFSIEHEGGDILQHKKKNLIFVSQRSATFS